MCITAISVHGIIGVSVHVHVNVDLLSINVYADLLHVDRPYLTWSWITLGVQIFTSKVIGQMH